jgi:uncharacterized RmlC-like cupin family protein
MADTTAMWAAPGQLLGPLTGADREGPRYNWAGVLQLGPEGALRPRIRLASDVVVACLQGWAATLVGDDLSPLVHGPGEFVFVPAGLVHATVNLSTRHELIAVESRTGATYDDSVAVLPLERPALRIAANLRDRAAAGSLGLPQGWSSRASFDRQADL